MSAIGKFAFTRAWLLLGLTLAPGAASAQVNIVLGGNNTALLGQALTDLNRTYTLAPGTMVPDPTNFHLGQGDFIIMSNDGGTPENVNLTNFLNAGGHVIAVGGSSLTSYQNWVSTYFNITDFSGGWHTDGAWTNVAIGNAVTSGLPNNYTFVNNLATFHMLGFATTTDTLLYGQNGEGDIIGALRTFSNGGTFNYLALDIGVSNYVATSDYNAFVVPWLRSALATSIPEPSTVALCGSGLAVLGLRAWRRRIDR